MWRVQQVRWKQSSKKSQIPFRDYLNYYFNFHIFKWDQGKVSSVNGSSLKPLEVVPSGSKARISIHLMIFIESSSLYLWDVPTDYNAAPKPAGCPDVLQTDLCPLLPKTSVGTSCFHRTHQACLDVLYQTCDFWAGMLTWGCRRCFLLRTFPWRSHLYRCSLGRSSQGSAEVLLNQPH